MWHIFSATKFFFLAEHSHCVLHCDLPALCSLLSSISDVIDISGEELYFERSAQIVFHLIKHLSLWRFHFPGYTDGRKMAFSQLSTALLERQSLLSENWMILNDEETSLLDEPSLQRPDGAAHFDYQRAITILLPPEAHTQPSTSHHLSRATGIKILLHLVNFHLTFSGSWTALRLPVLICADLEQLLEEAMVQVWAEFIFKETIKRKETAIGAALSCDTATSCHYNVADETMAFIINTGKNISEMKGKVWGNLVTWDSQYCYFNACCFSQPNAYIFK